MLNTEKYVESVLGSGIPRGFKGIYGIDTEKYDWVDKYLKDVELRKEIDRLREEIPKIEGQLMHREELKARFLESLKDINKMQEQQIFFHLLNVQARTENLISPESVRALKIVPPVSLGTDEINTIIAKLPSGVRQAEIDRDMKKNKERIEEIRAKIDKELSPSDRWFYHDTGERVRYPQGCRWTLFVKDWKMVVSRFDGVVNIEGFSCVSEAEATAFYALGMGDVRKLTPLRKPHEMPPRPKMGKELHDESVRM